MNNSREQSEFNMAISYLNRLNTLFYIADDSSMSLDVNAWMHSLMAIFRELSTEMKDEEITTVKTMFKTANVGVQKHNKQSYNGKNEVSSELYDELHDIEMELRKVLKSSGLQMKMKADAAMALEDL